MALLMVSKEGGSASPTDLRAAPVAVLKVTATWCGPCKSIQPYFVELCEQYRPTQGFILDIDQAQKEGGDAQQLLGVLNVTALPTFVAFNQGVEVGRCAGSAPPDLAALFAALVKKGASSATDEASSECGSTSCAGEENCGGK